MAHVCLRQKHGLPEFLRSKLLCSMWFKIILNRFLVFYVKNPYYQTMNIENEQFKITTSVVIVFISPLTLFLFVINPF